MCRLLFLMLLTPVILLGSTIPHPTVFVANQGQWPKAVLYGATTENVNVWITKTGMILDQTGADVAGERLHNAVTFNVIGSTGSSSVDATNPSSVPRIYIQRSDNMNSTALPTASTVVTRNVRPGVHLEYVWDGSSVRYNVLVDPGVKLPSPLFNVSGATSITATSDGFNCQTSLGSITMSGLAAYCVAPNRTRKVISHARGSEIGFAVSNRNQSEALTVDPIVSARAIRGIGNQEVTSMALDRTGRVVVAGWTSSFDIEIPSGGATSAGAAGIDGFVACLTPDLKTIIAWTYIAGDSNEAVRSLAVSNLGDIWVTGETNSKNLPVSVLKGGVYSGAIDGFVLRYSADLSRILAGKYIAGNREDRATGIVCDIVGDAIICGQTKSTTGLSSIGGYDRTQNGGWDGFVMKIDRTGSDVVSFTYYGSPGDDAFTTVAVDNSGGMVVGGWTNSIEFEMFPLKSRIWVMDTKDYYYGGHWEDVGSSPYDIDYNGGVSDAVIVKFNADGLLVFATYFGGSDEDRANRVLVDSENRVALVGTTKSNNLPIPAGNPSVFRGKTDVFVFGLSADGLRLRSCLYFGGKSEDNAKDAAFDAAFNVTITGSTTSDDIEALGTGTASARAGMEDGFLATLSLSDIMYSTLFGWAGNDAPQAIVRDVRGDCFIAGATSSALPGQTSGGATDGFITKWAFGRLEMRAPLAGALFCTGTPVSVSWITEDISPTSTYSLDYSTDDGLTWLPGPTGIKQKSTTWTVPNARPESGKVLLRISSLNGHTALGLSAYTVESAPVFVDQPRSATFCPGSMIELAPIVESGSATYQWRKNGTALSGATQRVFSIASARSEDAGSYDVIATTLCKSVASSAAVVSVSAQPTIRTQPQSANLSIGASVTLRVQAEGQALTYQWQLNDAPINAATSDTLLLSNVSTSQQGRYRCTVGSACGSTPSAEAVISVGSLAVRDEDSKYQLLVSPQPASDVARITTPFAISTSARIQLHNVDGVNVAHAAMISTSSPTSLNISLTSLPQGTYTLVLHDGSVLLKQIIVVKR